MDVGAVELDFGVDLRTARAYGIGNFAGQQSILADHSAFESVRTCFDCRERRCCCHIDAVGKLNVYGNRNSILDLSYEFCDLCGSGIARVVADRNDTRTLRFGFAQSGDEKIFIGSRCVECGKFHVCAKCFCRRDELADHAEHLLLFYVIGVFHLNRGNGELDLKTRRFCILDTFVCCGNVICAEAHGNCQGGVADVFGYCFVYNGILAEVLDRGELY